ncbi:hypothetical protein EV421DRAFT_1743024 [Armillaria borealis]|uniref:Uncharacterized protein n=1 Tax=Armillaria borealis TaxID=47425 RepID=A0AA39MF87_9AGAR|nr:hypothetical protein EV421DRAFT_1743024 [Armillaria borealis]
MAEYFDPASFYRIHKCEVFLQLGSVQEDPLSIVLRTSVSASSDQECTKAPLQAMQGRINSETRLKTTCKKTPPRRVVEKRLSNLKSHMKAKHPDIKHLKQTRQTKRCRKISKHPLSPPPPPIVSPSDDNSDVLPQPPTGRFPLPPSAPPLRKSKLSQKMTQNPLAAHFTAARSGITPLNPNPRGPGSGASLPPYYSETTNSQEGTGCVWNRACQPAPSSSSANEGYGSPWSRFPLPTLPLPTSRLITLAFTFNRLPSPSSSSAPSPTFEIPFSLSREVDMPP